MTRTGRKPKHTGSIVRGTPRPFSCSGNPPPIYLGLAQLTGSRGASQMPRTVGQDRHRAFGRDIPKPPEPWRTINPYRGLLALQEQDADFLSMDRGLS